MSQLTRPTVATFVLVAVNLLLLKNAESEDATTIASVWEVVTPFREHITPDGRLKLLKGGTSESGLEWRIDEGVLMLGPSGSAKFYNGGLFARGKWPGGQQLNARLLMNDAALESEQAAVAALPETAGQTWAGERPSGPIANSIEDLWEFVATVPRTKKFIRRTVAFTADKQVLDGNRRIGTYAIQRRAVSIEFVDDQFGKVVVAEKTPNVLSGRSKARNGQAWNLQFARVQKQAMYRTDDKTAKYLLFNNNRVNSPQYTSDFDSTWHWYFYPDGTVRRLWLRNDAAVLTPDGKQWAMSGQKAELIEGTPLKP